MESKIIIPQTICEDEVIGYIASRYSLTPTDVIYQYVLQEGIIAANDRDGCIPCHLENNEMAILRDIGLRPSSVEFVK